MSITNRREAEDVLALVRAVAPAGRTGIALSTLASRVQMDLNRVESLLKRHAKYFVSIGGKEKYTLNRFEELHGSAERIIADVEQSFERGQRLMVTGLLLSLMGTLMAVTAFVSLG